MGGGWRGFSRRWSLGASLFAVALTGACSKSGSTRSDTLLAFERDVPVPGGATRFDYQAIDGANGQLVIAHMNDNAVLVLALADGSVRKVLPNIQTPRGVAVGDGKIFVTSKPAQLVIIDGATLAELARVTTGTSPDGNAFDADDKIVAVSDQGDGALSLIKDSGMGARTKGPLGKGPGNVVYDASRKQFWITVVGDTAPNELVEVAPSGTVTQRIPLPGCDDAHGLHLHPDGRSAYVACEGNDKLARVELDGAHAISMASTGAEPDVLSIDAVRGWLHVAAESGDLTIWNLEKPGLGLVGHDHPGDHAHTVAADPVTHRVFFPLQNGNGATPIVRIMRPRVNE